MTPPSDVGAAIRSPKAELHIHLEGALEPEMALEMARRNGVSLPYASAEELHAAYKFRDLQSFLDLYYRLIEVLRTEEDFYELAMAYFKRAHADGVVHAEPFFDPQAHTTRGVAFSTVVEGFARALDEARARLGISARLIMCFLRDMTAAEAMCTLESAEPYLDRIVAVGLDSAERGNPPSKFAMPFERARKMGLRAVAHAGEEGPASYIREALDILHVDRIDHGIRCMEDPALVRRLADERIPITVCPLSNVRLRVVRTLPEHPLRRMIDAGLAVCVNSDDPAYFGGYVNDNLSAVAEALALSAAEVRMLVRNSLEGSFLSDAERAELLSPAPVV